MEKNKEPFFIIEHLEPVLGKWVWFEYKHASKIVGRENIIFTNVKNMEEARKLIELGSVFSRSVKDLPFNQKRIIVLDPNAKKLLEPRDFRVASCVVVGGILGDHPPAGRTEKLISRFLPFSLKRSLGKYQFSIDGAVYLANEVRKGKKLEEIPVKVGLDIRVDKYYTITLPFAFPLVNKRPLISEELVQYLKKDIVKDEEIMLKEGKIPSVVNSNLYVKHRE